MKGRKLDLCLSMGYFRMQQDIFTCRFVLFDDTLYSVHWLRVDLANVTYGKEQLRLLRVNEKFAVTVKPFILTDEIVTLYAIYRNHINFDAPESVESCLFNGPSQDAFDTYVVEVRDGNQLIAAGIFDCGSLTTAGIMNFYHPDYRKYSLGKFLMLQKINYARRQQKVYYYPGYLVSNYPKFDYKLYPCQSATEVFDANTGRWYPFSWEMVTMLSADMMNDD